MAVRHTLPPSPPSVDSTTNGGASASARPRAMGVGGGTVSNPADGKSPGDRSAAGIGAGSSPKEGEGKTRPKPKSIWKKCWDYTHAATYYKHTVTKESRWANAEDPEWMEATDPASGHVFLEHATTGESRWKGQDHHQQIATEENTPAATTHRKQTVWEELKEPGSGLCYYYSSASQTSQWHPPVWIDFLDTQENYVYYFNTRTKESRWDRPAEFVIAATEVEPPEVTQRFEYSSGFLFTRKKPYAAPPPPPPPPPSSSAKKGVAPGDRSTAPRPASSRLPRGETHPVSPLPPPSPPPEVARGGGGSANPAPPAVTTGLPPPPPPPPNKPRDGGGASPGGHCTKVKAYTPTVCLCKMPHPVPSLLPHTPLPPWRTPPSFSWSPRGSVPPPPGPPPARNMPPAVEDMAVDS
ncbi:unnamed protein product, partial [Pylaiella littoralis]